MKTGRVLVPVLLDLTGLRVLFVGAGEGTRVKLAGLVEQNPSIRLVAPLLSPAVVELVAKLSDAEVHTRPFEEADLEGVSLVYGMTDDRQVNSRVAELCRSHGLWSNVAGERTGGSFTSPAVARRGGLIAAFSSADGTPRLSAEARDAWREAQ